MARLTYHILQPQAAGLRRKTGVDAGDWFTGTGCRWKLWNDMLHGDPLESRIMLILGVAFPWRTSRGVPFTKRKDHHVARSSNRELP